ncbi:uncharacterized protein LOC132685555 [Panthera onca]
MCVITCSSPCLLTRLSGSSDSWPGNKYRIVRVDSDENWHPGKDSRGHHPPPKRNDEGDWNWLCGQPVCWDSPMRKAFQPVLLKSAHNKVDFLCTQSCEFWHLYRLVYPPTRSRTSGF